MSDEKNDNDKKKKDNDPYDFFKLVTDSDKTPKDGKKPKVPLWLILIIGFSAESPQPKSLIAFSGVVKILSYVLIHMN